MFLFYIPVKQKTRKFLDVIKGMQYRKGPWSELGQEFENLIRSKYIFNTKCFLFNLKSSSCSQGILFLLFFPSTDCRFKGSDETGIIIIMI